MRTYGLVSICLLLLVGLSACGNEDEINAKLTELKDLRAKLKAVNTEFSTKHPERQKILDSVIPAKGKLMAAKRSEDKGRIEEAQAAFDDAEAAAKVVLDAENDLKRQITELKDKVAKVEKQILKLGGKVPKAKKK